MAKKKKKVPEKSAGSSLSRSGRTYLKPAAKATGHPVRHMILMALKEAPRTTVELEDLTGEARYNLYHHLEVLQNIDLVDWTFKDGKSKEFFLKQEKRPQVVSYVLERKSPERKSRKFKKLIELVTDFDGQPPPRADDVVRAEIHLYYPWSDTP